MARITYYVVLSLVKAKKQSVKLRQSYLRLATRARREVARLIHSRGHKQAMRHLCKMRTWTGRLVRDIERKIDGQPELQEACAPKLERVKQFLIQKPDDKHKICALHAPEVECVAKGKARTRYEFGVKVSIAVTNARADGGQFVIGIRAVPGLPYDGHTLKDQIAQVGTSDRYGGKACLCRQRLSRPRARIARHPCVAKQGQTNPDDQTRAATSQRHRTIIGHTKSDGLLERNRLAGARGYAINAILVGADHNIRFLLAWLRSLLSLILALIATTLSPSTAKLAAT